MPEWALAYHFDIVLRGPEAPRPMAELPTPSQTVGPFFNIGLPGEPPGDGPLRISGTVYDGEGRRCPTR